MRNVGGSIGISVAQTLLTRRSATHQNYIINSVQVAGQQFQNSLHQAQQALTPYFGPANTGGAAGGGPAPTLLYEQLGRQALNWAFVDVFRWLSLLCFVSVACVWLMQKVKPGAAPPGAH
jgi:MFS transporter, DHA2 family, multidrug resistance protein